MVPTGEDGNIYHVQQEVDLSYLTPETSLEGYVQMNPAVDYQDDIPTKEHIKVLPKVTRTSPASDLMLHDDLPPPSQEAILNVLGSGPAQSPKLPVRSISVGHTPSPTKQVDEDILIHTSSERRLPPDYLYQPERQSSSQAGLKKQKNNASLTEMTRLPNSPILPVGVIEASRRGSAPVLHQSPGRKLSGNGEYPNSVGGGYSTPSSHPAHTEPQPYIEPRLSRRISAHSSPPPPQPQQTDHSILQQLKSEFPNSETWIIQRAIGKWDRKSYDRLREEVNVEQLYNMKIPYITEEDCRRALTHCQNKLDRAAMWLLEQSETISSKKT